MTDRTDHSTSLVPADTRTDHEYRLRAVCYCETVTPARYDSTEAHQVCQRRQYQPGYSGCGDLAHAMFEALDLHNHTINRSPGWRCGKNVSLLVGWEGVALGASAIDWSRVDGGDVLIVRSHAPHVAMARDDSHVMVVLSCHPEDGLVTVAQYGQPKPTIGLQATKPIGPTVGSRPWQVWLPLPLVLRACGVAGL